VFCGSSQGSDPAFAAAAERLGTTLASTARTLIYGGGHVGLMGIVADAALNAGGTVIGVIPRSLAEQEIAHRGLSELHVVESMHERKALMAELSDGFIVLPGGIGTLDAVSEPQFASIRVLQMLGIDSIAGVRFGYETASRRVL